MTAIGDHCDNVRSWLNYGPETYPDSLITSWTRMAEEMISTDLRCKHMIAVDTALVEQSRVSLPTDWEELDFVRFGEGGPIKFRDRYTFYSNPDSDPNKNQGYYTITGNYLILGGNIGDGVNVEISYYESVPPLGDEQNWLMKHYSRLYLSATVSVAKMYASGEEQQAMVFDAATQDLINRINERHMAAKSSGSRLNMPRKTKGFG
jgi:hypothetical protein